VNCFESLQGGFTLGPKTELGPFKSAFAVLGYIFMPSLSATSSKSLSPVSLSAMSQRYQDDLNYKLNSLGPVAVEISNILRKNFNNQFFLSTQFCKKSIERVVEKDVNDHGVQDAS